MTAYDRQQRDVDMTRPGKRYVTHGWQVIQRALIAVMMQRWWITLSPFVALHIAGLM